ncbi:transient receptor potential cation channel protein painless-like [Drosophila albomicans]|uniref:Transient receptor potential cation channel protein painless-like n=1 Tax=Drosophila albomicans TaxID=7291 RepID=A0A9C6W477_DROAB|nr:transient receptor potential cation channel protein painless-like [Drosophila albomicans]
MDKSVVINIPDIPNSKYIEDIDHKYENQTALNYLASHLTLENASEIRECMELLLRNGAEVNAMDDSGEVPLSYVMKNTELSPNDKYELVYMLLQRYTTEDSIAKEAWNYLETYHMKKHSELKRDNLEDMISKRKNLEDMISTNQQIGKGLYLKRRLSDVYSRSNSLQGNYIKNILERYANRGDVNAMKMLHQILGTFSKKDIDIDFPLMCKSYGKEVFQELLNTPNLQIDYVELAKDFIETMPSEFDKKEEHIKHVELLQILLKRRDGLASAADEEGLPLLSYAALKRNEVAVRELLRHGAYMGMRNDYKVLPIKNIRPEVIEEHLDYCIQMDAVKSNDSNITMDFTNICHPPNGPNTNPNLRYNDMSTIAYIKKSRNLHHLLNHPIVSTILVHKWQKYSKFFYTHFAIYLIFIILLTTLIVSDYRSLSYVCLPFIFYLAIHEVVQYNISPVHYFREFFVNGLDILVIILSIIVCCPWWTSRNIETFAVLASCFRLFSHMSLIPIAWISKPFRMLFMVINTVFKLGILILVVFLFGLCFYIQNGNGTQVKSANETDSISFDFDTFASALMKSTIMATGEYDAGNINIISLWQYLLLFVFVIIVGISLFNLLVAKALNDIQLIQNQAEIFSAINRINVLNTCEVLLYVNNETGKAAINYAAESLYFSNLYLLINFEQEKHEEVSSKTNKKMKNEKKSTETIKETFNKKEETGTSNHNSVTINVENSNVDRSSANEVEESIELLPQKNVFETSKRKAVIKDIDHKYQNQTALNYLASHLTLENSGEIRECMELLLRNGAKVNAMDDSGEVPLSYVMKNTELRPNDKYELIYRLLQRYTTADLIAKEAWNYLETNHMKKHSELKRDNLEEMISKRIDSHFDIDYMGNILESYETGDKNALNVLRQIFSLQSKDFNYEFLKKSMSIEKEYVLEELLKNPKLQVDYVKFAKWVIEMKDIELLKVLLKSKDGLASAADEEGIPLLRFATLKYSDEAVRILLSNGAYMGMRSDYKTLPIKNIKTEILEEHLDNCIQMDDENVIMDFSNISQPPNETNLNFQKSYTDMSTISYIRKSKNLRHLLSHPMVSTFLTHS